jgi:hypothetical protein
MLPLHCTHTVVNDALLAAHPAATLPCVTLIGGPCSSCRYRTLYEGLQEVRSSCDAAVGGLAAAKEALLAGFNQWADQQAFGQVRVTVGRDCGLGAGAMTQ